MAYFIMFAVGVGKFLLGDFYANVSRGWGFEERTRNVVHHEHLRSHVLVGSNRRGFMDQISERL